MRLDLYLTTILPNTSRSKAKNLIELNRISVNGRIIDKPAFEVNENEEVLVVENYSASLGSIKLERAFSAFNWNVIDKVCVDLGAANGGFTEVLLRKEAKKVYAVDVGTCALPDKLQSDERIVVMDKTNARFLQKSNFSEPIERIVCDLSFISLKLILPIAYEIMEPSGEGIFLIKPQFELSAKKIPKSGIVRDEKARKEAVEEIQKTAAAIGFIIVGTTEAPHPFEYKNQEYLLYLKK